MGFFCVGTATLGILQTFSGKGLHPWVEIPLLAAFACFSAMMVFLTVHKTLVLCLLHMVITATLTFVVLARLGFVGGTLPGMGYLAIGTLAFIDATGGPRGRYRVETQAAPWPGNPERPPGQSESRQTDQLLDGAPD